MLYLYVVKLLYELEKQSGYYLRLNFKYWLFRNKKIFVNLRKKNLKEMGNFIPIDKEIAFRHFRPIEKSAHKGTQGHALILGGSYGKMGSVCLSTKACLKSGAGLVTAYIPKCGYTIVQTAVPEVMVITDDYQDFITSVDHDLNLQAIGLGMGMGTQPETHQALFLFLNMNTVPLVIDADALNILSLNKEWLALLPKQSILTPHKKELERLIGTWQSDEEMIVKVQELSHAYDIVFVIKGAPTLIVYKDQVYQNTTGNQALATAGSGDVLTGIITGLLAQHHAPLDASLVGVYLHGLTADLAVGETGFNSFTASDIIGGLGKAFLSLQT